MLKKKTNRTIGLIVLIFGISSFITFSQDSLANQPTTWEEFDAEFSQLAEDVSFLTAEITDGACQAVHGLAPDRTLAIGSGFKLYILGALGHQIAERQINLPHHPLIDAYRTLDWEDPLAIQEQYKAIPHGPLLYVPEGSKFTIRYFAEQMIQRSDNTATDHLLYFLGRPNVEQQMARMGHHNPALNTPLFGTREFAIIKYLWTEDELATYLAASDAKKRLMLSQEKRGIDELNAYFDQYGDPTLPTRIDTVEWFADRYDMCRALMSLHQMSQQPKLRPVTEILTLEDQIGIDREDWIYVGYKGGSELGVLAGNWLLQRNDGRLFVLTMALNDQNQAIDIPQAVELLQAAVELLFQTP